MTPETFEKAKKITEQITETQEFLNLLLDKDYKVDRMRLYPRNSSFRTSAEIHVPDSMVSTLQHMLIGQYKSDLQKLNSELEAL